MHVQEQIFFTSCLFFITSVIRFAESKLDRELYCQACKVITDEIDWEISKVDPKKTIQVESFRVDPQGNQKYGRKIQYARSETHFAELLENFCDRMNQYAQSENKGEKTLVRTSSRDGEPVELHNVSLSQEKSKTLKHACEKIIEEHEEDLIHAFQDQPENAPDYFCQDLTAYCPEIGAEEHTEDDHDENDHDENDHDEL